MLVIFYFLFWFIRLSVLYFVPYWYEGFVGNCVGHNGLFPALCCFSSVFLEVNNFTCECLYHSFKNASLIQ